MRIPARVQSSRERSNTGSPAFRTSFGLEEMRDERAVAALTGDSTALLALARYVHRHDSPALVAGLFSTLHELMDPQ